MNPSYCILLLHRYGNSSATAEDLQRAIEKCNLVETIAKLKHGLQTSVGERGARLSGGERQKVRLMHHITTNTPLLPPLYCSPS